MLNSQSPNTIRGKSLFRTMNLIASSVEIKLENLPLNSPKFIWLEIEASVWICERCVKCTGCMPQLIRPKGTM